MRRIRIVTKMQNEPEGPKRTSCRIPKDMLISITKCMQVAGYSQRGRSKWISESLTMLSDQIESEPKEDRDYYFKLYDPVTSAADSITISLSESAYQTTKEWTTYIQDNDLGKDDAQTRFIHLAISMRLLSEGGQLVSSLG